MSARQLRCVAVNSVLRAINLTGPARSAIMSAVLVLGMAGAVLAQDTDGDGMSDDYEILFLLNYTNSADASEDPDGDGLVNLQEFQLLTDARVQDSDRDGFIDSEAAPVSRAFIKWGDPQFTDGDQYSYCAPAWVLGCYRVGGAWSTNPVSWFVPESESNAVGSLNVDLDRDVLTTNNLRYRLEFDSTSGMLFMDLLAADGATLVTNLFGNIQSGSNTEVTVILDVPLATYTNAAVLHLYRQSGETRVLESLLYIDEDADGLDREMEQQLGTSDYNADSDGDGLSDYDEVFIYGTDPTNPDTDGDGMKDGWEVLNGLNPKVNDAGADSDGDGVSNLTEYLQGRDPMAGAANDVAGVVNLKVFTRLE